MAKANKKRFKLKSIKFFKKDKLFLYLFFIAVVILLICIIYLYFKNKPHIQYFRLPKYYCSIDETDGTDNCDEVMGIRSFCLDNIAYEYYCDNKAEIIPEEKEAEGIDGVCRTKEKEDCSVSGKVCNSASGSALCVHCLRDADCCKAAGLEYNEPCFYCKGTEIYNWMCVHPDVAESYQKITGNIEVPEVDNVCIEQSILDCADEGKYCEDGDCTDLPTHPMPGSYCIDHDRDKNYIEIASYVEWRYYSYLDKTWREGISRDSCEGGIYLYESFCIEFTDPNGLVIEISDYVVYDCIGSGYDLCENGACVKKEKDYPLPLPTGIPKPTST